MCNLKIFSKLIIRRILLKNIGFLIFLSFICNQQLYSQQLIDKAGESEIQNFKEELFVRADRDLYITGEKVWLKVYTLNGLTHSPYDLSKVVYLELLDKNNFPLKQIKIKTDNASGSSNFVLPDNISSGNYILRAYTNWMKNFPTDQFFYKTISVINPFESINHLNLPIGSDTITSGSDNMLHFIIADADNSAIRVKGQSFPAESNKQINYSITLEKPIYSSGEKIKMKISATDMVGNPVKTDLSVSVAKSSVANSNKLTSFYCFNKGNNIIKRVDGQDNLAELEGHLISGYMRLKTTDEPLKKTALSLSFVG